ncbi:hypothetical protein Micbo1qcDRAFT_179965 [Microdochium bolleyi]|uniref:Uncharacterized protein n=1 Tax=Microdochium bolleyi TaxID=196109 RepID=A0A136INB5_9PEZI|nr:hypothetical protein Micbo1qcDRAFT_179965 [Microdochium bolleyi]
MWNKYIKSRRHPSGVSERSKPPVSYNLSSSPTEVSPVNLKPSSSTRYRYDTSKYAPWGAVSPNEDPPAGCSPPQNSSARPRGFSWGSNGSSGSGSRRRRERSGTNAGSIQDTAPSTPLYSYPPGTAISEEYGDHDGYYVYAEQSGDISPNVIESEDEVPYSVPYEDSRPGKPPLLRTQSASTSTRQAITKDLRQGHRRIQSHGVDTKTAFRNDGQDKVPSPVSYGNVQHGTAPTLRERRAAAAVSQDRYRSSENNPSQEKSRVETSPVSAIQTRANGRVPFSFSYSTSRSGKPPALQTQTARATALQDGYQVISPPYTEAWSSSHTSTTTGESYNGMQSPSVTSPSLQSDRGEEELPSYTVPYTRVRSGVPPIFRMHTEPSPDSQLDAITRIELANKRKKGHKVSHSLPNVGKQSKLQKRRAFTGELQLRPRDLNRAVPDVDTAEPAALQQQRLLQQLYGYGGRDDSIEFATTPPIETATAVPFQLRRSISVPLPGAAPLSDTGEDKSELPGLNKPLPAISASAPAVPKHDSVDSMATARGPTWHEVGESPILSHATYVSHPRTRQEQRPRESPAELRQTQPEEEPSRPASLECRNRPKHPAYSPMNPYAEWTNTSEPSKLLPEPARSSREKDIPAKSRFAELSEHGGRGQDASDEGKKIVPLGKAPRIPTLALSTEDIDWPREQPQQPPLPSPLQERDSETTSSSRSTTKSSRYKGLASRPTANDKPASPAALALLNKSFSKNRKDFSFKEQSSSGESSMRVDSPVVLDDDIIRLYWDSQSKKPEVRTPRSDRMAVSFMAAPGQGQSWDGACREYFVAKYRERLAAETWKNEPFREVMGVSANPDDARYPLPGHSYARNDNSSDGDILPYLLNDRMFFLVLTLSASLNGEHARQLWELFGTHPGHLLSIYSSLSAANRPKGMTGSIDLGHYLANAIESARRTDSPYGSGEAPGQPSFDSMMNTITRKLDGLSVCPHEMILRQVKAQLRRLQLDLRSRPALAKCWAARGPESDGSNASPLFHGLQQYLSSHENVLQRAMKHANDQLVDLSALLGAADRPFPTRENPAPATDVTLVFDAPGSGKTRFLRDKILETGGFYFIAPNLPYMRPPVPPKDNQNRNTASSIGSGSASPRSANSRPGSSRHQADMDYLLLGASRSHASRDTYTLYEDLSCLEAAGIGGGGSSRPVLGTSRRPHDRLLDTEICIEPLLTARRHLLDIMPGLRNPIRWLQLQIVASTPDSHAEGTIIDIFDIAYRFFRLSPRWGGRVSGRGDRSLARGRTQLSEISSVVPICIDEGQAILGDNLSERILQGLIDGHHGHAYIATTSLNTLSVSIPLKQNGANNKSRPSVPAIRSPNGQEQQQQDHSPRTTPSIDRVSSSRTNVGNSDTFWSVLSHHAWSVVSELFELQTQPNAASLFGSFGKPKTHQGVQLHESFPLLTRDGEGLGFTMDFGSHSARYGAAPTSPGQSWSALEQDLLANWTVFAPDSRDATIEAECSRFFGRVRWTATFTEELLRGSVFSSTASEQEGRLSPRDVRAASKRAAERIKTAVKRQMHNIGETAVLYEFLATAVQVDTCGVSKEFFGETASQLVSAGLALVYDSENGSVASVVPELANDPTNPRHIRARLAEPLVLEAALEFIHEGVPSARDGLGDKSWRHRLPEPLSVRSISDVSGRTMVETAVTSGLKPLLHFPFDEIAQHRRSAFLAILQSAESVSGAQTHHSVGNLAARLRLSTSPMLSQGVNIAKHLAGTLERYHLYDSGLDIGSNNTRVWTAEEWLMAQHTTTSTSDNSFYQSLPNFFFVPEVEQDNEGSCGGGLGSCMFFLTDYEDMSRRMLCVVQFPPGSSTDTTHRKSSCSSALSPLTMRVEPPQWPTTSARLAAGENQDPPTMSRLEQLRAQIQQLLPRMQCNWPVVYVSVTAEGSGDHEPSRSSHLSPSAATEAASRKASASWSRLMDGSQQWTAPSAARDRQYAANGGDRFGANGYGNNYYDSRDSYYGSDENGGHNYPVDENTGAPAQRPSYCVQVDHQRFSKVCGETLMKIVMR